MKDELQKQGGDFKKICLDKKTLQILETHNFSTILGFEPMIFELISSICISL